MCNTGHSTLSVVHLFVSRHGVIWLASLLQKDADEKHETQSSCRLLKSEGVNSYKTDFHEEVASVKRFFRFSDFAKTGFALIIG